MTTTPASSSEMDHLELPWAELAQQHLHRHDAALL